MFRRPLITVLASIFAIATLGACQPAASPGASPTLEPTAVPSTPTAIPTPSPANTPTMAPNKVNTPMSTIPSIPSGPEPAQVTQAKDDLARRLSIKPSAIEVVSFQSVTWSDGSMGCPKPGMAYIQILTEGYRIQLRVSGRVYEYHGGKAGPPFLCENPKPPVETGS